jgi:hypothetical protein
MRRRLLTPTLALSFLASAALEAQVAWDAPTLIGPGAPSGFSILLWDAHPSSDLGVLGLWRPSAVPTGVGFRGGLADDRQGDLAGMFAFDISGSLGRFTSGGDASVVWWTGAGLGVGDELLVSLPLGLAVGWRGSDEGVTFAPYVGGHVALDILTGPADDMDLDGAVDLGIDLTFGSALAVRFGVSVGGRDALAVGLRLPG